MEVCPVKGVVLRGVGRDDLCIVPQSDLGWERKEAIGF